MLIRPLVAGAMSYLPGPRRYTGTGGTNLARYCYAVWLRALSLLNEAGLDADPRTVVELGPGDSIGTGVAAMLTGADRYFALDVLEHANTEDNLRILDELVPLLKANAATPDHQEFGRLYPRLDSYAFPAGILGSERMNRALAPARIDNLRRLLTGQAAGPGSPLSINYVVPWLTRGAVAREEADLVMSQGALQDVDPPELAKTHATIFQWLKPGGAVYHHIDLSYPHAPKHWNEHWTYPDFLWRVVLGRRPYYFNRVPLSEHLAVMEKAGFEILLTKVKRNDAGYGRTQVAQRFRALPDDDFTAEAVTVIARRR